MTIREQAAEMAQHHADKAQRVEDLTKELEDKSRVLSGRAYRLRHCDHHEHG